MNNNILPPLAADDVDVCDNCSEDPSSAYHQNVVAVVVETRGFFSNNLHFYLKEKPLEGVFFMDYFRMNK